MVGFYRVSNGLIEEYTLNCRNIEVFVESRLAEIFRRGSVLGFSLVEISLGFQGVLQAMGVLSKMSGDVIWVVVGHR